MQSPRSASPSLNLPGSFVELAAGSSQDAASPQEGQSLTPVPAAQSVAITADYSATDFNFRCDRGAITTASDDETNDDEANNDGTLKVHISMRHSIEDQERTDWLQIGSIIETETQCDLRQTRVNLPKICPNSRESEAEV